MTSELQNHRIPAMQSMGETLPISALGPDCFREVVQPENNNNVAALLVRRDETRTGWAITELPAMNATVTCGGISMTSCASWSNFSFGGIRYGLLDISSIYNANFPIHVSYLYANVTYYEDFPAGGTLSGTDLRDHDGQLHLNAMTGEPLEPEKRSPQGQVFEQPTLRVVESAAGSLQLLHEGNRA